MTFFLQRFCGLRTDEEEEEDMSGEEFRNVSRLDVFFILPSRVKRSRWRRCRQSIAETLAGSAFLAHAVSYELGNVRNISLFWRHGKHMLCFVTFWCEGKQARLRSFSAAPLNRGFRNVTWQDVFRFCSEEMRGVAGGDHVKVGLKR